jgi:hypothetical protein
MRSTRGLHVVVSIGLGLALLAGCEQKGPAQKAGEKVDKAVESTGKEIQKAGEKLKDATK